MMYLSKQNSTLSLVPNKMNNLNVEAGPPVDRLRQRVMQAQKRRTILVNSESNANTERPSLLAQRTKRSNRRQFHDRPRNLGRKRLHIPQFRRGRLGNRRNRTFQSPIRNSTEPACVWNSKSRFRGWF